MNTIYEDKSASQKFGQVIKALRKKRQFTQEDLSEKSDIGVQYISRIETGHDQSYIEGHQCDCRCP